MFDQQSDIGETSPRPMRASVPRRSSPDAVREGTAITRKSASGSWTSTRIAVVPVDATSRFHVAAQPETQSDMVAVLVRPSMTTAMSDTTIIDTINGMCSDVADWSATGRDTVDLRNSEERRHCAERRTSTGVRGVWTVTNRREGRSSCQSG